MSSIRRLSSLMVLVISLGWAFDCICPPPRSESRRAFGGAGDVYLGYDPDKSPVPLLRDVSEVFVGKAAEILNNRLETFEGRAGNPEHVKKVTEILRAGGLAALKTETVYGLCARADDEEAVRFIYKAKNRPLGHPIIVHISAFEDISRWAVFKSEQSQRWAKSLAGSFWPGPLTMLLYKADGVSDVVTGWSPKIGLRCPRNAIFLAILRALGTGLAAPSANPYKGISPTTAQHVIEGLRGRIHAVLDDGQCEHGTESTIIDLTGDKPRVLRPGPLSKKDLETVLGVEVEFPKKHDEHVSGNVLEHYKPTTPAYQMLRSQISSYIARSPLDKNIAVILCSSVGHERFRERVVVYQLSSEHSQYAHDMYASMHTADAAGVSEILIERPPEGPEWADVNDRLGRAAPIWTSELSAASSL